MFGICHVLVLKAVRAQWHELVSSKTEETNLRKQNTYMIIKFIHEISQTVK